MLEQITYYLIFGKPLIMYLGITELLAFTITASIQILRLYYGYDRKIPFAWHPGMAAVAFTLAAFHGILGLLAYF